MYKKEEQKATVNQQRFMIQTFYGHQLPATSSIEDGQHKAEEKVTPQTKESVNNSINEEGQTQITLSSEELKLLAYMPKTCALLQQVMQESEAKDAQECANTSGSLNEDDRKLTLVDLEEVMFEWPTLTEAEIRFVEIVNPLLRDFDGRKHLCYTTGHLAEDLLWWGFNGFGQRTIQRRLLTLWEKGIITNRYLKTFDLQRYVSLYYYTKVFTPLMRVFEPLAPVVQDKERQRQAEQEEWERRKQLAMGLLNCYLVPWDVKVVDKEGRLDE